MNEKCFRILGCQALSENLVVFSQMWHDNYECCLVNKFTEFQFYSVDGPGLSSLRKWIVRQRNGSVWASGNRSTKTQKHLHTKHSDDKLTLHMYDSLTSVGNIHGAAQEHSDDKLTLHMYDSLTSVGNIHGAAQEHSDDKLTLHMYDSLTSVGNIHGAAQEAFIWIRLTLTTT